MTSTPQPKRALPRHWTDDENAYLCQHYAHCPNEQLARILGRDVRAIVAHANLLGLHKSNGRTLMAVRAQIATLAARPGGMRTSDMPDKHLAANVCGTMVKAGKLFAARISHKHVIYCSTQAAADALLREAQFAVSIRHAPGLAWWDKQDPSLQPIITPRTRITICPSVRADPRTNRSAWGAE